jgi:hypothetical protein
MEITQQEVSRILQDIDDCIISSPQICGNVPCPTGLGMLELPRCLTLISVLADDMEEHFDDYGDRIIEEEDPNFGFNEVMDLEIMGMLQSMRIR